MQPYRNDLTTLARSPAVFRRGHFTAREVSISSSSLSTWPGHELGRSRRSCPVSLEARCCVVTLNQTPGTRLCFPGLVGDFSRSLKVTAGPGLNLRRIARQAKAEHPLTILGEVEMSEFQISFLKTESHGVMSIDTRDAPRVWRCGHPSREALPKYLRRISR